MGENETRPYERCMSLGAASLSDAQLLAAILRTGTTGIDATELALKVMALCKDGINDKDNSLLELYAFIDSSTYGH